MACELKDGGSAGDLRRTAWGHGREQETSGQRPRGREEAKKLTSGVLPVVKTDRRGCSGGQAGLK